MTAAEMFSTISAGSFFEKVFDKELDWDAELDARTRMNLTRHGTQVTRNCMNLVPLKARQPEIFGNMHSSKRSGSPGMLNWRVMFPTTWA